MILFDSHAHYDDGRFEKEFDGGAIGALREAKKAGVRYVVNSGACLRTTKNSFAIAEMSVTDETLPAIYVSAGIHPSETDSYDSLDFAMSELEAMLSHPRCVAVGEIGLDYHYPETDKPKQYELFEAQLALAKKYSLPVVIHSRDAHGDTFDILKKHAGEKIMLHCYSGSGEMARQYAEMGFSFSFGGVLTFKNAAKTKEAVLAVPKESLLLETDCPYLAPVPHRGKLNYSAYMTYTAAVMGELLGMSAEKAAELTLGNAKAFFGIN